MNLGYIEDKHLPELLRLNNIAVPAVNSLTLSELESLVNAADVAQLMADEYALAGFLIGFSCDADDQGVNFQWCKQHFQSFFYIERMIVAPTYRSRGVHQRFLDEASAFCKKHALDYLLCSVSQESEDSDTKAFLFSVGFEQSELVPQPRGHSLMIYRKKVS